MNNDRLREILRESFDAGYSGMSEQETISYVIEKFKIEKIEKPPEKKFDNRIFKIEELKRLPVGTVFMHSKLGRCDITKNKNEKYMTFANPGIKPARFQSDGYPWDAPMQLLEMGKQQ